MKRTKVHNSGGMDSTNQKHCLRVRGQSKVDKNKVYFKSSLTV